jgi:hypothetical protein
MKDEPWAKIFKDHKIYEHDFAKEPFYITSQQIKDSTKGFRRTGEREVRILCKQDSREQRPSVFKENGLFILPVRNGKFAIIKGEGYVDIPDIDKREEVYHSRLEFELETAGVGNSEMQHLDFAYASSLIRTFINDESLVLTIRGRKYTPQFSFKVRNQEICVKGVQTEVDAGYEGKDKIVLIEAKNAATKNVIIRQLYYPYRKWRSETSKQVIPVFFERRDSVYLLWQFEFTEVEDYNSIRLVKSGRFSIKE